MKKLTKIVAVVAAFSLSVLLFAGCSCSTDEETNTATTTGESDASITVDITKLTVGFDKDFPPYGYVGEDDQPTGFDLDLARDVAERNGWDIELVAIDWGDKYELLNEGTINCIWNGFTMEGRGGLYTFTEPYMSGELVIVTKVDSGITSFEDLAGKSVVAQTDSYASDILEGDQHELASTFASLDTVSDYSDAFTQLKEDTYDAVVCDSSVAAYRMATEPDTYAQLEESLGSEHYGVGFKLDEQDLANLVNDTLLDMYNDGTIEELCDKYDEYGISFDNWILR